MTDAVFVFFLLCYSVEGGREIAHRVLHWNYRKHRNWKHLFSGILLLKYNDRRHTMNRNAMTLSTDNEAKKIFHARNNTTCRYGTVSPCSFTKMKMRSACVCLLLIWGLKLCECPVCCMTMKHSDDHDDDNNNDDNVDDDDKIIMIIYLCIAFGSKEWGRRNGVWQLRWG